MISINAPTFSWPAVDAEAQIFYRLRIRDGQGNWVHTARTGEMLTIAVPADTLMAGQTYFWRVEAGDADDWIAVQNRANSKWLTFQVAREN